MYLSYYKTYNNLNKDIIITEKETVLSFSLTPYLTRDVSMLFRLCTTCGTEETRWFYLAGVCLPCGHPHHIYVTELATIWAAMTWPNLGHLKQLWATSLGLL